VEGYLAGPSSAWSARGVTVLGLVVDGQCATPVGAQLLVVFVLWTATALRTTYPTAPTITVAAMRTSAAVLGPISVRLGPRALGARVPLVPFVMVFVPPCGTLPYGGPEGFK
jgi:hypothetical protein